MTLLYSSALVGLNRPRVLETGVDYTRNTGGPEPGDVAGKRQRTQDDVRVYPIPPMAETENPAQQQIPEERRIEQKPNDECTHGVRLTRIRINCGPMAGYSGKAPAACWVVGPAPRVVLNGTVALELRPIC